MNNIFTVDVEDWYQTSDFNIDSKYWGNYEKRVEVNTGNILDLLKSHNVKATFFILSSIAQEAPGLIKRILDDGHEIGTHGCCHKMVNTMDPKEFRKDIHDSVRILENMTGTKVKCYRAPTWSISSKNLWALEILEQEGIECDSSFQPFKTYLYGDSKSPLEPFHPIINNNRLNLIEVPSTVLSLVKFKIPFSGGAYLRVFPMFFIKWAFNKVNKKKPVMLYTHPWEIDKDQPRIKTSCLIHIEHYLNLGTTYKKLDLLLDNFRFNTLGSYLDAKEFPYIKIDNS